VYYIVPFAHKILYDLAVKENQSVPAEDKTSETEQKHGSGSKTGRERTSSLMAICEVEKKSRNGRWKCNCFNRNVAESSGRRKSRTPQNVPQRQLMVFT